MLEWIKVILGVLLLLSGVSVFLIEVLGVYRFSYVLNRMHAAATGDTLGIGLSMLGLMILSGWNFTSLKMALVVVFLWFSSPVSSHLIARLEITVNERLYEECRRVELGNEGKNPGDKNLDSESQNSAPRSLKGESQISKSENQIPRGGNQISGSENKSLMGENQEGANLLQGKEVQA